VTQSSPPTIKGRITFANPIACALTGWRSEEATGRPLAEVLRLVAEADHQPIEDPVVRVLSVGTVVGLTNHTLLIDRGGVERPIADCAAPIRDAKGQIVGVVLVFRDVTERRHAEQERAALLEREQAARAQAEAANRAKDRFLAVLSHELRTPLTPVLLNVSALLDDPGVPPGVRSALELTRRYVELEARLIDDLLDINRIVRGRLTLGREVVDAHELMDRALEICHADLRAGGLELARDLAAEAHHVEADPARLQQVFWNLIKNAVKFTPSGGRITIRTRNEPPAREAGPRLVVEVADTGFGIAPELLPRIFDAFEQGENWPGHRRAKGLGLGLAISRSIIEAHGGHLVATSAGPDQGATFTLDLATVPAPAPTSPDGASRAEPLTGRLGLRLLLVEDDEATLRIMARLLAARGYTVTTARTVAEGLDRAAQNDFDLVISDLGLPDGNGLELMRRLRAQRNLRGIALSGFGMDDDIRRSHEAGFEAHLTKPVDLQELEATIQRISS
jgi:PAS domain S-box-containing protein